MFDGSLLAYVDPGSGSILAQAALAGILGLVWRITSRMSNRRGTGKITSESGSSAPASDRRLDNQRLPGAPAS